MKTRIGRLIYTLEVDERPSDPDQDKPDKECRCSGCVVWRQSHTTTTTPSTPLCPIFWQGGIGHFVCDNSKKGERRRMRVTHIRFATAEIKTDR